MTLLGVVLLLVLAASRGWFSPPARIGAGAALGVVLIGARRLAAPPGERPHRRRRAGRHRLRHPATWCWPRRPRSTTTCRRCPRWCSALLVAGGGLGLADRWRSQLLAGGVVVGAALLAPVLVAGWLLVALVLALQIAALRCCCAGAGRC